MSALDLPSLIHELGRGARGARPLSRDDSRDLFAAMLDGTIPDLELGGILIAYRIKGETADELAGMLDACQARLSPIAAPTDAAMPVVIPSYNGARKLPNLTPLLALTLAARGIPVLVHGDAADGWGRVASASVFAALGIGACSDTADIELALQTRGVAFAPTEVLSPALARLIALRDRLGVRGPAHTLVKLIQPFAQPALRLVNYTHPEYRDEMTKLFLDARIVGEAGVLLARGNEGEAVADPRRQVGIEWLRDGHATTLVEAASGDGTVPELPPSREAQPTARWIERALADASLLPAPLAKQIETISDICLAKNTRTARIVRLA
ncbi:DNA-binding protein YbiB [Rudaea sp.]|uniref:DNA-binding protein YbiB n=1 Tax=Rudaea sp. TaxID=2136325 RepID=UPI002ED0FCD7